MRKPELVAMVACLTLGAFAGLAAQALDCSMYENFAGAEPPGYAEQCLGISAPAPGPVRTEGPTDTGYAHDIGYISDNFVSFVLNDFAGQTVLGSNALPLYGYDFDPTGTTLYALDASANALGTVSTATGAFTAIGSSTPVSGQSWTGLSIHPVSGVAYATSTDCAGGNTLYTLDLATGAATQVAAMTGASCVIDLAVKGTGAAFVHDIVTDSISTLDLVTGAATLLGPTGLAANFAQGMDFDNSSGRLYIWLYSGAGANTFGWVNQATGAVTALATDSPLGEFEGAIPTAWVPVELQEFTVE